MFQNSIFPSTHILFFNSQSVHFNVKIMPEIDFPWSKPYIQRYKTAKSQFPFDKYRKNSQKNIRLFLTP